LTSGADLGAVKNRPDTVRESILAAAELRARRKRTAAAVAAGVAYGSGLCWASVCAVASFRVAYLAKPYWPAIPGLRTDTCGAAAFVVAAISLALNRYMRLSPGNTDDIGERVVTRTRSSPYLAALAVSETLAVLATGLVVYLSLNAVTHPVTLSLQATHFAPWPTEGTLRAIALVACVFSVGVAYYLRGGLTSGVRRIG
jgi:hypothetical protein